MRREQRRGSVSPGTAATTDGGDAWAGRCRCWRRNNCYCCCCYCSYCCYRAGRTAAAVAAAAADVDACKSYLNEQMSVPVSSASCSPNNAQFTTTDNLISGLSLETVSCTCGTRGTPSYDKSCVQQIVRCNACKSIRSNEVCFKIWQHNRLD